MNGYFIPNHKFVEGMLTGFLITVIWSFNVSKIALSGWNDKMIYAIGCMTGTGLGMLLTYQFYEK